MRNVVVLTGRGGSKSIPKKNVHGVLGRPLAYYPMHAARLAKLVDKLCVSTDCPDISALAREMDIEVIARPPELSTDEAELGDALEHALGVMGGDINFLISMHCNCPVHRGGLIDECIASLNANPDADSCVSGYVDRSIHPFRTKRITESGLLERWLDIPAGTSTNRQKLEPCFVLDGACRVMRVQTCFPPRGQAPFSYLGNKILYRLNEPAGDIHSLSDITRAEHILRALGWKEA